MNHLLRTHLSKRHATLVILALACSTLVVAPTPAQAFSFSFTKKLDLNPAPFTDGYAYWHGKGKYSGNTDVWDVTVTLDVNKKFANVPVQGVITLTDVVFQAVNKETGESHGATLSGTVSTLDNSVHLSGLTNGGTPVELNGVVRAWWTVQGTRKGAMVIQGTLGSVSP